MAQDSTLRYFARGGVRVAYRVDLPQGSGPHPAVVIAHGAGRRQMIADLEGWLKQRLPMSLAVLR